MSTIPDATRAEEAKACSVSPGSVTRLTDTLDALACRKKGEEDRGGQKPQQRRVRVKAVESHFPAARATAKARKSK